MFLPPYNDGRCSFKRKLYSKSGVYLISYYSKIVYIGMSKSSVYDAMYRHFQSWNDNQYRVVFNKTDRGYKCMVILTDASTILEKLYIKESNPEYNIVYTSNKWKEPTDDWMYSEYKKMQYVECPF